MKRFPVKLTEDQIETLKSKSLFGTYRVYFLLAEPVIRTGIMKVRCYDEREGAIVQKHLNNMKKDLKKK